MPRENPSPRPEKSGRPVAWFHRFARWTAFHTGRPSAFLVATLVIAAWAVTGPLFDYSDTWQLAINTGTTIVTFLMVFLIQHTQNRDSQAVHLKLDELIRAQRGARNTLLNLDDLSDEELEQIRNSFAKLAAKAQRETQASAVTIEARSIARKR